MTPRLLKQRAQTEFTTQHPSADVPRELGRRPSDSEARRCELHAGQAASATKGNASGKVAKHHAAVSHASRVWVEFRGADAPRQHCQP